LQPATLAMTLKIGVYLTDDVARLFWVALRRSGKTKSALVNEALARLLDPRSANEPGQGDLRLLKTLLERVRSLQRETTVLTETLAMFIRYFLMLTPPLREHEREAAQTIGRQRYDVFVREIARRIVSDNGLITDVMRVIVETQPELAARAVAEAAARERSASGELPLGVAQARRPGEVGRSASHA
jgi:hypothetical protein